MLNATATSAGPPPTPLTGWVGTACQRLVWMRAADKTDGHHVDTLSTFIYKGPVETRQTEEEESLSQPMRYLLNTELKSVVLTERLLAEIG